MIADKKQKKQKKETKPLTGAYLIAKQISEDFPWLRKAYKISNIFTHHMVVSHVKQKGWAVHELVLIGDIASTFLTLYSSWQEMQKNELRGGGWKILKQCQPQEWNERKARSIRRLLLKQNKKYQIFWNNCQHYARLIFDAGRGKTVEKFFGIPKELPIMQEQWTETMLAKEKKLELEDQVQMKKIFTENELKIIKNSKPKQVEKDYQAWLTYCEKGLASKK